MDAAGYSSLGAMDVEERLGFLENAVEGPCLEAARGTDGVAVHWVARPHDDAPVALDRADQCRQVFLDLVGAKAADERQAPGLVGRVQNVDETQQAVRIERGPDLDADGVADATQELNVRVIGLTRAITDP